MGRRHDGRGVGLAWLREAKAAQATAPVGGTVTSAPASLEALERHREATQYGEPVPHAERCTAVSRSTGRRCQLRAVAWGDGRCHIHARRAPPPESRAGKRLALRREPEIRAAAEAGKVWAAAGTEARTEAARIMTPHGRASITRRAFALQAIRARRAGDVDGWLGWLAQAQRRGWVDLGALARLEASERAAAEGPGRLRAAARAAAEGQSADPTGQSADPTGQSADPTGQSADPTGEKGLSR